MGSAAMKMKTEKVSSKRMGLKEKFAQPSYILEQMAQYLKDGDVASITDLISAYISNNKKKYSNQDEFAKAIGTTRQTLHRMLSHSDAVSMKIFFGAIEQIHQDASET
jgi:hypothetical protein